MSSDEKIQHRFLDYCKTGDWKKAKQMLSDTSSPAVLCCASPARRWAALHFAVYQDSPEMVKFLLESKADPRLQAGKDVNDKTPIQLAATRESKHIHEIRRLLSNADKKEHELPEPPMKKPRTDKGDSEPIEKKEHEFINFAKAAKWDDVKRMTVEVPGIVSAQPACRWSALHFASAQGRADIVKFLVDNSADVNAIDKDHKTPAEVACAVTKNKSAIDEVKRILRVEPPIKKPPPHKGESEETAKKEHEFINFAKAAKWDDVKRMTVEVPGIVTAQPARRWSALHFASAQGRADIVKFLVDNSADVNAIDKDHKTPAEVACAVTKNKSASDEVKRILRVEPPIKKPPPHKGESEETAKKEHEFINFAKAAKWDDVKRMTVEVPGIVSAQPARRWSALHFASAQGRADIVKFLLDSSADVNAIDTDHKTPAEVACAVTRDKSAIDEVRRILRVEPPIKKPCLGKDTLTKPAPNHPEETWHCERFKEDYETRFEEGKCFFKTSGGAQGTLLFRDDWWQGDIVSHEEAGSIRLKRDSDDALFVQFKRTAESEWGDLIFAHKKVLEPLPVPSPSPRRVPSPPPVADPSPSSPRVPSPPPVSDTQSQVLQLLSIAARNGSLMKSLTKEKEEPIPERPPTPPSVTSDDEAPDSVKSDEVSDADDGAPDSAKSDVEASDSADEAPDSVKSDGASDSADEEPRSLKADDDED